MVWCGDRSKGGIRKGREGKERCKVTYLATYILPLSTLSVMIFFYSPWISKLRSAPSARASRSHSR